MKTALMAAAFIAISLGSGVSAQEVQPGVQPEARDRIEATVNGQPIKSHEVDNHVAAVQLSREDALEDLIDLRLIRAAAAAHNIAVPDGILPPGVRADIEYRLAVAMSLDIPRVRVMVIVDHAWLKDAEDAEQRAAGRSRIEQLRALAVKGATIPEAYSQLNVDGAAWHIGDHEEYLTEVLPAEVHNLAAGSLSPIIPGDGGLHLFRIYSRTEERPPRDEYRSPLLTRLRLDADIALPEPAVSQ